MQRPNRTTLKFCSYTKQISRGEPYTYEGVTVRVLIVDDNAVDRYLLKTYLEHRGCDVMEASDGAEGLHLAGSDRRPDLIVSDALMPTMDGFQFLRSIKSNEALRSIPFIFYSAVYTGHDEEKLARSLGAEAFIIKPKDPEEFWEELQGIIELCNRNKEHVVSQSLIANEEVFLNQYSHVVAAKLEEKVRELETAKAIIGEKEQDWRETFNTISDCVSVHDTNFDVLLANRACEKLLGASLEEICSRKCYELFHGTDEPHKACPMQAALLTGNPSEAEIFAQNLGCWLSVSCFPIFGENRIVRGVVHLAKDITARKTLEEALKKSEAQFRAAFEQAAVGIAHVGINGRWQMVNQKLCDIVGYSREELLSKSFQDITHADDLENDLNYVRQMLTDEIKTYSLEKRYIRKDGAVVWIYLTVSLVRDEFGQPEHFIAVIEDINDRKKIEAQLLQSQKMESIGTLAGGIAHDFNNILTAITGYSTLSLMKMAPNDPQRNNIQQILAASDRAAHLTKDLLLFSRKQPVEKRPVDLNQVVVKVEKFLKHIIGEDITYKTVVHEVSLMIMADEHRLEQVLINLATNAGHAMPKGGALTVSTDIVTMDRQFTNIHGYGQPGTYALLAVTDSGTGMDEATRLRIFEPFFTTKEVGKGTGLGLAVVYGIIKEHNGFINVYSEPDTGTTFRVYLPAISEETLKAVQIEEESAVVGGTETVLLAEDDEMVRALTKCVLTEFGYTVIEAVNGVDAVKKFTENKDKVELLLLDLIMPKMNGKEAFDEIRKIRPDIKTIFVSGYAPETIRQKASLADSAHMIAKPVSPKKLLIKVRRVLDEEFRPVH